MAITMTIQFSAPEGRHGELVAKLHEILPDTRAFEGCDRVELFERDDSNQLLLFETWATAEQYEAYKAWRRDSGTSILSSDLVDGPPDVTTWNALD